MKAKLFSLLLMLFFIQVRTAAVEIDGINYNLNTTDKTAEVTSKSSGYYSGDIVISKSVEYNGEPYLVTSIGDYAFSSCSGLISIIIPNSVTSIGDEAFYYCSGLTSITIPNSVTKIGSEAFNYCSGLTSITIPNSVTSIGDSPFYQCSGLTSITVDSENDYYDSRENCNAIIESASNTLIAGCMNSTIPNSVTCIGNSAFSGCSGLISIIIPNSVTCIGNFAFFRCSGLTSITIPNSVTSIGDKAFYYCSGLTSITISNSLTSTGDYVFEGCSSLTSITIPNSVTSIGYRAFMNCSGLTSITIPNSVTNIGSEAFSGCRGLTSITIPNSVTSIGNWSFYGCNGLTSVTVGWDTPLPISSNTFPTSKNATLYVPEGTKAAYEAADYWKEFKEIKEIVLKCATPTITFANGKLHFECETEGVTYYSCVSHSIMGNDVPLSATYTIQVYASKVGYKDSDVATEDINVAGLKGDVNSDGEITAQDASLILQYVAGKTSW